MVSEVEVDRDCFRCGAKCEEPFIAFGGFVRGKVFILALHFDCYFEIALSFNKRFEETRKWVLAGMERPQG
jgi:poly(A) polymerase Pap1